MSSKILKKNVPLTKLVIDDVAASSVRPNSYNPNSQGPREFELLLKSLSEDGFTQPVVVCLSTQEIVDGEHRWRAWIVLNYLVRSGSWPCKNRKELQELRERVDDLLSDMPDLEIPVCFVNMTPEQARIATLRHNRARGQEDLELTANVLRELKELEALDWAKDSLLLADEDVNRMIDRASAAEALAATDYTESWKPEADEEGSSKAKDKSVTLSGKNSLETMTAEERRKGTYRVTLTYFGEEAKIVRSVLKETAADIVLRMCKDVVESCQENQPETKSTSVSS
jgi:ParB-like chromosome segregation protein Spo0J